MSEGIRRALLVALPILVLDQLSKIWVLAGLGLEQVGRIEILPPYLVFQMAWNRGVNFGLFSNSASEGPWILIALSVAICVALLVWARRMHGWLLPALVGVVIGGALGNALDRALYGAVADFLNMSCCGITNPFSFNVADVAIFGGAAGLVLFSGRDTPPKRGR